MEALEVVLKILGGVAALRGVFAIIIDFRKWLASRKKCKRADLKMYLGFSHRDIPYEIQYILISNPSKSTSAKDFVLYLDEREHPDGQTGWQKNRPISDTIKPGGTELRYFATCSGKHVDTVHMSWADGKGKRRTEPIPVTALPKASERESSSD